MHSSFAYRSNPINRFFIRTANPGYFFYNGSSDPFKKIDIRSVKTSPSIRHSYQPLSCKRYRTSKHYQAVLSQKNQLLKCQAKEITRK